MVNVKRVEAITGLSQPAANALTNALEETGILHEITGKKTYRVFAFGRYLDRSPRRMSVASSKRRGITPGLSSEVRNLGHSPV